MVVIPLGWRERTAAAQVKLAAHHGQRLSQGPSVREGPEISRPIVLLQARERKSRNRVLEINFDEQEAFIVTEADVVPRLEFLDQLAFQQQRLRFALHDMRVE